MKKSIFVVATALFSMYAEAQQLSDEQVPQPVKAAFEKQYPGQKVQKWEKEGENYEAEFEVNKMENSVVYDASGNLLETEQEIELKEIPAGIVDYCAGEYAGYKIAEAAKINSADGALYYEVEMKKGKEELELLFDANGNFVKLSKEKK